ncbi:hypothetical protein PILCRDRAFT_314376 [Piloderma croceum F 1598]|uniref:Uncharacterized protein n=1 Tax=Piloderma croceum (strain F 1598) TaxID=765440 RepID=A0A0C3G7V8_PILCF|nr:hypothetical protein PILCRDRAFT_314376 [Piloderma croceum F 1598]
MSVCDCSRASTFPLFIRRSPVEFVRLRTSLERKERQHVHNIISTVLCTADPFLPAKCFCHLACVHRSLSVPEETTMSKVLSG